MKKFLCVLLTLTMLLSSMVFVVSAAKKGESNTEIIWINNCDSTAGNKGTANHAGADAEDKTEGEASLVTKHGAGSYGPGGFMWQFGVDPVDVTGASYFCMDFYISDASVLSGNMHLELTSSGGPDVEESMYPGITLKDGWNNIKVPLALFGNGCDFTRFNFMRLFNCTTVSASKEVVCKIDNVHFECGDKISFNAFTKNDVYFIGTDNRTSVGHPDWGKFADGNGRIVYAFEIPEEKVPYVNKIEVCTTLKGAQPALLVSSNGVEWKTVFANTNGNGSVYVDVTSGVDFNKSNILYVAIGDADTSNGNGGQLHNGTRFDVLISYSDVQARAEGQYYSFRATTESEDNYCIQKQGKVHDNDPYRYHDNSAMSVWKYVLADATELTAINYTIRMAANGSKGGLLLQVSLDNKEWTDIHVGGADSRNAYTFNLMKFIDVEALQTADVPTIYIRMGDATPDNGWGGQIWHNAYTTLAVVHNPPPASGIVGMMDRIFTEFKILSKVPFLSRLFKSLETLG